MEPEWPVTMAVSPVPSIPWVTSSAVEVEENPDGPFLLNSPIRFIRYSDDTEVSTFHTQKASKTYINIYILLWLSVLKILAQQLMLRHPYARSLEVSHLI